MQHPAQTPKRRRIGTFIVGLLAGLFLATAIPFGFGQTVKKAEKPTSDEMAQANALLDREKAVAAKEKELAEKDEEIKARQEEMEGKLTNLLGVQEDLKAKIKELEVAKEKQFRDLIKIYSAMSPSKVAPLLNQMEDEEVLKVLKGFKTDQVAKILPKLDQQKAVRLSRMLGQL